MIIIDINEQEGLKTASEIQEKYSVKTKSYKVDVSSFEAFQELRNNISRDFNGQTIDILINNAGILSAISLTEGHYTQVQKVVDVNLTSHFWVSRDEKLTRIDFELIIFFFIPFMTSQTGCENVFGPDD